jgi:multiple sugar transport system ATP-binding protein
MAQITLDKVSKRYGNGVDAVKELSIEIQEGEFVVLVGPSGCGKTTALRMIAGLEQVSSGDVYIDGLRVNDVPERDRDIAMVFQNYALYPHMTVGQNIGFSLRMAKTPKDVIRNRVNETAEMLALDGLLSRRPKELSGGQRQRVAMGRAIIREPKAFLMDEPLSNLDAQLRVQMRGEIHALQRRLNVTTAYVTHDQTEAMTMGDRIAVMHDGVLQQIGSPDAVYARPANLFVAGFVGSPPMNLATARVDQNHAGLSLTVGNDTIAIPVDVAHRKGLGTYAGQEVVIGVRPEDLRLEPQAGAATITGSVERTEALGLSTLAFFSIDAPAVRAAGLAAAAGGELLERAPVAGSADASLFCASLDPHSTVRAGDRLELSVEFDYLHFFDPSTEQAISKGTQ